MFEQKDVAYDIESIIQEEVIDDKPHYLVKWKGYPATEATWEPIDNLLKVLDVLHQFKIKRNPHSRILIQETDDTPQIGRKKTKKIGDKQHVKKDNQRQRRLTDARKHEQTTKRKNKKKNEQESISLLSSDEEPIIEETNTHESHQLRKSKRKSMSKQRPEQQEYNDKKEKSKKKKSKHNEQKMEAEQIQGFKVVGKITKEGINQVVCCFDWEGQKVCEVELRDGRRVNMRREDIKKICPDKLCEYLEKLEGL